MPTKKILICDDEEGVRESLKLILGETHNLILTGDGQHCLDVLKNAEDVGLVLLDIKMPQLNGLEILKQIKKLRPDVSVIIITGYKSVETATEATKLGASGYIVKPFKAEEILETTGKILQC